MKIDVFCGWGDGPDVGINIFRTYEEVEAWGNSGLVPLDFTAREARELAQKLLDCAERAEILERDLLNYERTQDNNR